MRLWSLHPKYLDSRGLVALWREGLLAQAVLKGQTRGYRFDATKIGRSRTAERIRVTRGQLDHEWHHLNRKLRVRDPSWLRRWSGVDRPRAHPLFRPHPGGVAGWEKSG